MFPERPEVKERATWDTPPNSFMCIDLSNWVSPEHRPLPFEGGIRRPITEQRIHVTGIQYVTLMAKKLVPGPGIVSKMSPMPTLAL